MGINTPCDRVGSLISRIQTRIKKPIWKSEISIANESRGLRGPQKSAEPHGPRGPQPRGQNPNKQKLSMYYFRFFLRIFHSVGKKSKNT